jgi:hypothetical protein
MRILLVTRTFRMSSVISIYKVSATRMMTL